MPRGYESCPCKILKIGCSYVSLCCASIQPGFRCGTSCTAFWHCLSSWRDCACYKTLQSGDSPARVWSRENDLLLNWGWPGPEPPVRPGFYPKRRFGQTDAFLRERPARLADKTGTPRPEKLQPGAPDEQSNSDPGTTKVRSKKRFSVQDFFCFFSCFFSCFCSGEITSRKAPARAQKIAPEVPTQSTKKSHQRSRPRSVSAVVEEFTSRKAPARAQKIAPEVPTQERFGRSGEITSRKAPARAQKIAPEVPTQSTKNRTRGSDPEHKKSHQRSRPRSRFYGGQVTLQGAIFSWSSSCVPGLARQARVPPSDGPASRPPVGKCRGRASDLVGCRV